MANQAENRRAGRSVARPLAIVLLAVLTLAVLAGVLVLQRVRQLPREAAEGSRRVLESMRSLAAAFREGTIEVRFHSYATSVSGSTHLQFATVRRVEEFTRSDRASIFWGAVDLPDVVVSATAPVVYTAYLDLEEAWGFRLEGGTLWVQTPPIRFNRPAIDVSRLDYQVRTGSLLRDEEAVLEDLRRSLTRLSVLRSRELLPLVRDTGRQKVEEFVRTWLVHSFTDTADLRIEVSFADEEPPLKVVPED